MAKRASVVPEGATSPSVTRTRKGRARWDHIGLDVLRAYKPHPDATTPMGWRVRNGTTWYSLGEIVGDDVIAVSDEGEAVVLPLDETFRQWDPELDPLVFEELKKEATR